LDRLTPFLGTIVVKKVEMLIRQKSEAGEASPSELVWLVFADCTASTGRTEGCSLKYEPFRGRLVAFRR
jgi:hypothetical protein